MAGAFNNDFNNDFDNEPYVPPEGNPSVGTKITKGLAYSTSFPVTKRRQDIKEGE